MTIRGTKLTKFGVFAGRYARAGLHAAKLFSAGPFAASGREEIGRIALLERRQDLRLPPLDAQTFIDCGCPLLVRRPNSQSGNVSLLELLVLNGIVCQERPKVIFEIGTFDGRTTLNLAANSCDESVVYTLDLPSDSMAETKLPILVADKTAIQKLTSGVHFHGTKEEKKIRQLFGDSASFDFSSFQGRVNLFFIDGSHSYEYVLNDTAKAIESLASGGVIVWHDYGAWDEVTLALHEIASRLPLFRIDGTNLAFYRHE